MKPLEKNEVFAEFLDYLQRQSLQETDSLVKYSQTRIAKSNRVWHYNALILRHLENDNLRGEYKSLHKDLEPDIRFASIALQRGPDAINLWIGNSHSTTALHRDNYENIYCQILGSKEFVLLPPVETACVNEQFLPGATYSNTMEVTLDDPLVQVPCAIWDPDGPYENSTEFSHLSRPIRVTAGPGDMLYLPACW